MTNWSGVVVPIVVGVLALAGTLIVALVNNYVQSLNKPEIDVIIEPGKTKALINLANNGLAPATNLSLIIGPLKDFTQVTKKFGAAGVIVPQLPTINQTLKLTIPQKVTIPGSYLELRLPYLPPGEGSLTQIEVTNGTSNETFSDYRSAAVFDQGSTMGTEPLSFVEELEKEFGFFGSIYIFIFYYAIALAYAFYYLNKYIQRLKSKGRFKLFISNIRDQLMSIHNSFEEGQKTEQNILYFKNTWEYKTTGRHPIKVVDYLDMKDYIIIENLHKKLSKNLYNDNYRILVEDALRSIDWKKYL